MGDSGDDIRARLEVEGEENSATLLDEDIEQIIELDNYDDRYCSDDEDQQSTSNVSGMEENDLVDDSICSLQAHEQDCFAIAIAGGRWLASGGEDDVTYLWDQTVSESTPVLKIEHNDSVISVAFNNAETLLASADMSGKIIVTQLSDLKSRAELTECNDLEWMFWHCTSDIIFAGDKDGMIWMWLIGSQGLVQSKVLASNGASCTVGYLLPDGKKLIAGYVDGFVRFWSIKDQSCYQLNLHSPVTAIHHHVSQPLAAIGTQDGMVYIVSTAQEGILRKLSTLSSLAVSATKKDDEMEEDAVDNCVECVQMAPSHPWLAVGRNDGSLCIYEIDSSSPRSIFRSPKNQAIIRALWSMEGIVPYLSVGSVDGYIRVFDARDGSLYKELGNGGDDVLDMTILESDPLRIMTAGSGGVIRIFDLSRVI
uniref:WD_REPEATS_REGION domain-containing protein n=1 Tax=Heterorhabditis bacteriophora TaxID=37862 RepID=A0A1I7XJS7_HETBA